MEYAYGLYYNGEMHLTASSFSAFDSLTDEQKAAKNTAGGVVFCGTPRLRADAFYMAQAPIRVCLEQLMFVYTGHSAPAGAKTYTDGTVTLYRVEDSTREQTIVVKNSNSAVIAELVADTFNGQAIIDVAPVICSEFTKTITYTAFILGESVLGVDRLGLLMSEDNYGGNFYIHIKNNVSPKEIYAVNGVGVGNNQNLGYDSVNTLLTLQRDFVAWHTDDYALSEAITPLVSYYNAANGKKCVEVKSVQFMSDFNALKALFPNEPMTFQMLSITGCSPVAVLWINNDGGIDQRLFLNRHAEKATVKTQGTRYAYDEREGIAPYQIQSQTLLQLGVENVPSREYDRLVTLAKSWFIEIFPQDYTQIGMIQEAVPVWHRSYVDAFDGECWRGRAAQDYEITLRMPTKENLMVNN